MTSFRRISVLVLIVVLVPVTGCRNMVRKDKSLTVKEYVLLGMPDPGHAWTEDELTKAHGMIGTIRTRNFLQLPAKGSRKSGALFARFVSSDNLNFLSDTSMALREKAYSIQSLGAFLNDLSRMYTNPLSAKQYYSREVTVIHLFELEVRGRMLELAEEIDNSADPMDAGMKDGRAAIVNAYTVLVSSLIRSQEKEAAYAPKELRIINREVAASIVKNLKYLDPVNRKNLSNVIKTVSVKVKKRYFDRDFKDILRTLEQ